jgi:hypothetical protein
VVVTSWLPRLLAQDQATVSGQPHCLWVQSISIVFNNASQSDGKMGLYMHQQTPMSNGFVQSPQRANAPPIFAVHDVYGRREIGDPLTDFPSFTACSTSRRRLISNYGNIHEAARCHEPIRTHSPAMLHTCTPACMNTHWRQRGNKRI